MSRVGRKPIAIPANVTVTVNGSTVTVKGPKGELTKTFNDIVTVSVNEKEVLVTRPNDEKFSKQLHGTVRAVVASMVEGVEKGFKKQLDIKGIGYRAVLKGNAVELNVGYSHPVLIEALPGVKIEVPNPNTVVVSGCDKQTVGQVAALIRDVRRPEPYLGKGIAYSNEYIRRKEGKKAGKK